MSRNNLVIAHPKRLFWRYLPNKWTSVTERCPEQTDKVHKVCLVTKISFRIPAHPKSLPISCQWPQSLFSNKILSHGWKLAYTFYFLFLLLNMASSSKKILCGHNRLIASNVIVPSCTADYFSTVKSLGITTNPQGIELKRYPKIMNL